MRISSTGRRGLRPLAVLSTLLALAVLGTGPAHSQPPEIDFVPGRLLVKFKHGTPPGLAEALIDGHGASTLEVIDGIDVFVLELPDTANEHATARAFRGSKAVEFAELDELMEPDSLTPNDPSLGKQWHVSKIAAPSAWGVTTGNAGVVIAILDSGVDASHPDFSGKLVSGWNFYDGNGDTTDVRGHGTAVAGTAAAATDNGVGIAGVAWSCRLMPIRISDSTGYATYSNAAKGLTWASDHGARVANLSFRFSTSSTVTTAARYFQDRGGVVTISAGNQSTFDASADNPYVLTVGASTSSDTLASFSNTGNLIDVVAPGTSIYTTNRGGGYGSWEGTSFSAPVVAGIAALVLSANPNLTGAQAAEIIQDSADDLGNGGWDTTYGWGRVNAYRAVSLASGIVATDPAPDTTTTTSTDMTDPTVAIVSPGDQSVVSGSVSVQVSTSDDRGVVKVELYVDGRLTNTSTASPFTLKWNARKASSGSHSLEARAYDAAGNQAASPTVVVRK